MVKQRDQSETDREDRSEWILDAIAKIRYQKQCPNESRICNIVTSRHDVSYEDVLEYIKVAVEQGKILQIFNFKNVATYKDPRTITKLQSRCLDIGPGTDLVKVIVRCVRELGGESDAIPLSKVEEHIRSSYSVRVKDGTDLSTVLELQVSQAVLTGLLLREGTNFKLGVQPSQSANNNNHKRPDLIRSLNKTRLAVAVEDMVIGPDELILPFEKDKVGCCGVCWKQTMKFHFLAICETWIRSV